MSSASPTILIATSNPGKLREIQQISSDLPYHWRSLADFGPLPEAVEDADTFEGNAIKKALHYAKLTGLLTLADDSGLEVDALDKAPGVHSARYAGDGGDGANNAKLIARLRDVPTARRTARFVCVMVLANPGRVLFTARGSIDGLIIDEPRGENGFGYDPHFLVPNLHKTTAELTPQKKNEISHRGVALRALVDKMGDFDLLARPD